MVWDTNFRTEYTLYAISTAMAKENVLRFIPGDYIAAAEQALPNAATDTEAFREVVIDVPQWFSAKIRFKRFHSKRGKMSRWFWTAESAERIE
jgi:hypothetical protein